MSSFVRPSSAVLGLSWSVFSSSQVPGKSGSGIFWMKSGTKPSVLWMSARARAAAGVSAKALVEKTEQRE